MSNPETGIQETEVNSICLLYTSSDNKNAGYICGEDLIKKSPDGGTVAILECPTQNSMNERITGFEEAISKAEKGFEVVDRADTKGKFNKALKAAEKMRCV